MPTGRIVMTGGEGPTVTADGHKTLGKQYIVLQETKLNAKTWGVKYELLIVR